MTSPLIGKMPYTSKPNEWRQCGIWLRCENGERYTRALVFGAMAIHLGMRRGELEWYVSHVPTGRMAGVFVSSVRARCLAKRLAQIKGMNSPNLGRVRRLVAGVIAA